MTESEQRAAVVREALSWCGTRYHHAARVKVRRDDAGRIIDKGGADCATLLAEVYAAAGVITPVMMPSYPPDWHLHRHAERYLSFVLDRAREISEAEARPGDVVLFRFGLALSHGAIVIDPGWPQIVHALYLSGVVQQDRGDINQWGARSRRFFSPWGRV